MKNRTNIKIIKQKLRGTELFKKNPVNCTSGELLKRMEDFVYRNKKITPRRLRLQEFFNVYWNCTHLIMVENRHYMEEQSFNPCSFTIHSQCHGAKQVFKP